jgi:hypothetical protein
MQNVASLIDKVDGFKGLICKFGHFEMLLSKYHPINLYNKIQPSKCVCVRIITILRTMKSSTCKGINLRVSLRTT